MYDLVIHGGEVVDPGAGLRGVMDVAIENGRIAAVGPDLASSETSPTGPVPTHRDA